MLDNLVSLSTPYTYDLYFGVHLFGSDADCSWVSLISTTLSISIFLEFGNILSTILSALSPILFKEFIFCIDSYLTLLVNNNVEGSGVKGCCGKLFRSNPSICVDGGTIVSVKLFVSICGK